MELSTRNRNNPYGDDRPEASFVDNGKNGKLAFAMAAAASLTPEGEKSIYAKARDNSAKTSFHTTTFMLHGHTGGGIGGAASRFRHVADDVGAALGHAGHSHNRFGAIILESMRRTARIAGAVCAGAGNRCNGAIRAVVSRDHLAAGVSRSQILAAGSKLLR